MAPTCADFIHQTSFTFGSLMASMMSRTYGVRLLLYLPGSALASADSRLRSSAHSVTVLFGGGRQLWRTSASRSDAVIPRQSSYPDMSQSVAHP